MALSVSTDPVLRKAAAQDALFYKSKLTRQIADLFLVDIDQFAAGFAMHAGEVITVCPHSAADALARFKNRHTATAPLQSSGSDQAGKAGANDYDIGCHAPN